MKTSRELRWITAFLSRAVEIRNATPPPGTDLNWKRWLGIVDENSLGPFIGSRRAGLPEFHIPAEIQMELDIRYIRNGHAAALRQTEMIRLLNLLTPHAEIILLKGAALTPAFYAEAAERAMWDIDLLVKTDRDIATLQPLLESEGFHPRKQLTGHHHAAPLLNSVNEMAIELHTNLFTPAVPQPAVEEAWERKQPMTMPGCAGCYMLDPVAQLLHHSIHALGDPATSPLLRNLFEIAWMVNRLDEAQRAEAPRRAAAWNMEAAVARALSITARLFGTPPLMRRPARGAYDYWCESRLEWSNCDTWWERLRRHIGQIHIDRLLAGAGERDVLTLLSVLSLGFREAFVARFPGLPIFTDKRLKRRLLAHANVEDTMLVYDHDEGHVHLLNPATARIWQAAHERRPSELIAEFSRLGMDGAEIKNSIRALVAQDLLV